MAAVEAEFTGNEEVIPGLIQRSEYKAPWERKDEHVTVDSLEAERKLTETAQDMGFVTAVSKQFTSGGNIAYQVYKDLERIGTAGTYDPNWAKSSERWADENKIPVMDRWRYSQLHNQGQADEQLAAARKQAADADALSRRGGITTFAAGMLAGIVDVDAPLMFATGGLTASAKAGIQSTKLARITAGAAGGLASGVVIGAGSYSSDPNSDWTVIPAAGLMGLAFGAAGGALARSGVDARTRSLDEFGETVNEGAPRAKENIHEDIFTAEDAYASEAITRREMQEAADRDLAESAAERAKPKTGEPTGVPESAPNPSAFDLDTVDYSEAPDMGFDMDKGRASIGARQLGQTGPGLGSIDNPRIVDRIQTARTYVARTGIATDYEDGFAKIISKAGALGRAAERFHSAVVASPLASDFDAMFKSGSAVAQKFAYDMMENAAGIIRNGRSGARIKDHYEKQLLSHFAGFEDSYSAWATEVHGANLIRRNWDTDLRASFNREVMAEMQARRYDGAAYQPSGNARVREAADSLDRTFAHEVGVLRGRPGEHAVKGTDNLKVTKGYVPQKWLGKNMRDLVNAGKYSKKQIAEAISEGYQRMHGMKAKDANIYAKAVVHRAMTMDEGTSTNLIGLLNKDGREELEDMLRRNGMPENEIKPFIERIQGQIEERGKSGFLKERLDIDLRGIAANGVNLMDLVDTDIGTMVPKRLRRTSGQGALARKGITSRADWEDIKRAILAEQDANGPNAPTGSKVGDFIDKDKHLTPEKLDEIFTYFSGDPVAGGISPVYARIKKLTNLALLNQLGLTQLAELGPTIAAVGWDGFYRHLTPSIKSALKNVDSPLIQELKHIYSIVPEERLFRDDLVHEFEKSSATSELGRKFDRILNKGSRLQGFTSGFYAMRNIQQRLAVTSAADKIMRGFKTQNWDVDRLADMGLNGIDATKIKDYVDRGVVTFNPDGSLKALNFGQWNAEDVDLFAMTLNARVNTLVQKAMAGESSTMYHKDGMASLFWHLKSFPMLAMEKQLIRNARLMDSEAAMTFMYGLLTAGVAYSVRQTINGRTENLEPLSITKGAFGLSNMTGWIPMWTDPLAGMLGLTSLQVGGYQGTNAVISTPAAFTTLDRMAQIPGSLISSALGGPTLGDINALTATPIVGNAYGFNLMFNLARQSIKESNAEERKAKEKAKPAPEANKPAQGNSNPALEAFNKKAVAAGVADPKKYIENNEDAGRLIADILKDFD